MTGPTDFGEFRVHPAAEAFPLMSDEELDKLAADIKEHGLKNFITLHNGMILDGRNRLLACRRAGVPPFTEEYRGSQSPTSWVVSQNIHRRHLTESQRTMIGAALVPLFEAEAKERQRQGGREKVPARLPEAGEAREHAAAVVQVSPRSIQDGLTVRREGTPELVKAVTSGEVKVSAAAKAIRAARLSRAASASTPSRSRTGTKTRWSLPWLIADMAAAILQCRSPDEVAKLVGLLSVGVADPTAPTTSEGNR